jgi:hypothetical protein
MFAKFPIPYSTRSLIPLASFVYERDYPVSVATEKQFEFDCVSDFHFFGG